MAIQFTLIVAAILTLVLVGFLVIATYNNVVSLQRRCQRAWANVDVALKQRHDQLPNLVAAVRGAMAKIAAAARTAIVAIASPRRAPRRTVCVVSLITFSLWDPEKAEKKSTRKNGKTGTGPALGNMLRGALISRLRRRPALPGVVRRSP